ncbi:MAG: cadmium-translocating P-type ATPase [Phycisphaeraceae bacterium]|nr:cadmium-translocating P-type ATPase [Phycisphaeraceae bacterium]
MSSIASARRDELEQANPLQEPELGKAGQAEARIEWKIVVFLIGAIALACSVVADWLGLVSKEVAAVPAGLAALLLGGFLLVPAWKEIRRGEFGSRALVVVAVGGALALERYFEAGMLAFILNISNEVVERTASGARRAIEALVGLTPDKARVVDEQGQEREVQITEVKLGQIVRVRPGENLPVDGRIVKGQSEINQASLTGEAIPVSVQRGSEVYAGTTNLSGIVELEVTQVGEDTTIGKVTQLIREAESTKTQRQQIIEQVARFFVPIAIGVAFIVFMLSANNEQTQQEAFASALTVLVVAVPAALLLASPTAMVAAFGAAARLGILVKSTAFLEAAASVNTIIMDKTGTITTGTFEVTRLVPAQGVEGADLLRAAATAERNSNHPLAQSIVRTADKARVPVETPSDFQELHGKGVRAMTEGGELHVGRATWLKELKPAQASAIEAVEAKIEGISGVHVMRNGQYMGVVGLEDRVRKNTKNVLQRLRELGARHIAIFTGDRLSVAKRVGVAVGVDAIEAECLPEEKYQLVRDLVGRGYRVMMVGDGINDGPSLAEADVGVAMGLSGSDIAANSAGVALMNDDLSRIPFFIELARKTKAIILQNIIASILLVIVGLIIASTGMLNLTVAGLYQILPVLFVMFNSFRLFRFGESFAAIEGESEGGPIRRAASVRGLATA